VLVSLIERCPHQLRNKSLVTAQKKSNAESQN
jgi:hypothetical protein